MTNKTKFTHYEIRKFCDNCDAPVIIKIKKGITFLNYIKKILVVCNNCGCPAFRRQD